MNPEDTAAGARWPTSTRSRALLGAGVGGVALVGLLFGLGVADLTGSNGGQVAANGPSTSAPAPGTGQGSSSITTSIPTTTVAPSSSSTSSSESSTSSTSSTRPSTSSSTPSTALSTSSVATTPASTAPPPATIDVAYSQGVNGALVVPRNGSAIIQMTNTGGQQGQWSFSLPTPEYSLSQTTGTVSPGQTVTVTVFEARNKSHRATLSAVVSPGTRLTIPLETP